MHQVLRLLTTLWFRSQSLFPTHHCRGGTVSRSLRAPTAVQGARCFPRYWFTSLNLESSKKKHENIPWTSHEYLINLVGGFNHLEKYESQWEGLSHISWKNVWNHQPVIYIPHHSEITAPPSLHVQYQVFACGLPFSFLRLRNDPVWATWQRPTKGNVKRWMSC